MFKLLRRACCLVHCAARAGLRRRGARSAGASLRCGQCRMPTPRSICSARSTCCPSDYQWRTAKFDQAVTKSQQLVVETIVDDKNPTKIMSAMASLGLRQGPAAARRAGAGGETRRAAAAIKKSGVPAAAFDRMETWAAAFILLGNQFQDMGLKGGAGRRGVLRSDFIARASRSASSKAISSSSVFSTGCPKPRSVNCWKARSRTANDDERDFGGMLDAWSRGDVKAIARTFDRDLSASPELREALIRSAMPIGASGSSSGWPSPGRS